MIRFGFKCALPALLALAGCKTADNSIVSSDEVGDRRDPEKDDQPGRGQPGGRGETAGVRGQSGRGAGARIRAEAKGVDTTGDAQTFLRKGNEALKSKNYIEAEKYFEYVKDKYPFLDAAKEAELRLGDLDYDRDRMAEARDRYLGFVKLHPMHPKVDYAAFRAAMTHYKEIPSDFFLLPSSREKDQVEVKGANKAMTEFLRSYPNSLYLPQAKKVVDDTGRRLAEHEIYVADFYAKREKWGAVAGRLETVVNQYPGLGFDERALFRLHDAYTKLNDSARAQDALRRIMARFPGTPAASRARQMLGS